LSTQHLIAKTIGFITSCASSHNIKKPFENTTIAYILHLLLFIFKRQYYKKAPCGIIANIALEFGFSRPTISNLWSQACAKLRFVIPGSKAVESNRRWRPSWEIQLHTGVCRCLLSQQWDWLFHCVAYIRHERIPRDFVVRGCTRPGSTQK
jgi:hypothetical protein